MGIMKGKIYDKRQYPEAFVGIFKEKGILFTNDLAHHKVQRHAILKGMMKASNLKNVSRWATDKVETLLSMWDKTCQKQGSIELNVGNEMLKVGLDVIGKAGFGMDMKAVEDDPETQKLRGSIETLMHGSMMYNAIPGWVRSLAMKKCDQLLRKKCEQLLNK